MGAGGVHGAGCLVPAGGCGRCGKKCEGFLTDREQRKVWGIGILYVLGFPLLLLMTVVGGLKVI